MNRLKMEQFYVIGIATRTSNENGQGAVAIEALWSKFWNENLLEQIPNKLNDDIYAVYTDYEADFTKPYTTIIGAAVSSLDEIPANLVGLAVAANTYEKFVSKGKMPEAIGHTWVQIWADETLNSRRAYQADFTIHGPKYFDGDQAEVETFLSVR